MCNECKIIKFTDPLLKCVLTHRVHRITGQFHCKTNASIDYPAYKEYRLNGSMHRIDGPAYDCGDESQWFIAGKIIINNGKVVSSQNEFEKTFEFKEWKLKAFK